MTMNFENPVDIGFGTDEELQCRGLENDLDQLSGLRKISEIFFDLTRQMERVKMTCLLHDASFFD